MTHQKTICLKVDEELYNEAKSRAIIHSQKLGRYINAAIELKILFDTYQYSPAAIKEKFEEYYARRAKHQHRPWSQG